MINFQTSRRPIRYKTNVGRSAKQGMTVCLFVIATITANAQSLNKDVPSASPSPADAEDYPVVLTINQEPVSAREYRMVMQRNVASVFNYFKEQENLDDHAGYWADSGPTRPLARLRKTTLEELTKIKVHQGRAKELGLIADTSFARLHKDFETENARRAAAKASGEPIYGPPEYRLTGFYYVKLRDLEYALRQTLGKQLEAQVTDSDINKFYSDNQTTLKDRPLADLRADVIRVLGVKKAEAQLAQLCTNATVEVNESRLAPITPRSDSAPTAK